MAKSKYEVIIPWHGVEVGDIIEIDGEPNPAWESNLRKHGKQSKLTPATPEGGTTGQKSNDLTDDQRREIIADRLDELEIKYHPNLGLAKMTELLPEGELESLFPEDGKGE